MRKRMTFKGLYWRQHGGLRYFMRGRRRRFGMGLNLSADERMRLAHLPM
jgi:hypothetical protein